MTAQENENKIKGYIHNFDIVENFLSAYTGYYTEPWVSTVSGVVFYNHDTTSENVLYGDYRPPKGTTLYLYADSFGELFFKLERIDTDFLDLYIFNNFYTIFIFCYDNCQYDENTPILLHGKFLTYSTDELRAETFKPDGTYYKTLVLAKDIDTETGDSRILVDLVNTKTT